MSSLLLYENLLRMLEYAEIDSNFKTLITNSAGALAPNPTFAYMPWADTTSGYFKIRNAANTAWISLFKLDGSAGGLFSPIAGPGSGQAFVTGDIGVGMSPIGTANYSSVCLNALTGNFIRLYSNAVEKSRIQSTGTDLYIYNIGNGIFALYNNGSEVARFDSSGNFMVGETGASSHCLKKAVAQGNSVFYLKDSVGVFAAFNSSSNAAWSGADAAYYIGKHTTSNRSINASGTVNTSGADYAEYERKADTCGEVVKGQIIGFDAEGKVTDKWAEAISFGVKTTNPSYVGGDTWGSVDLVGNRPEQLTRIPDVTDQQLVSEATEDQEAVYETVVITPGDTDEEWARKEAQYAADLAAFETRLEVERQKVDRIAYSGKVPCNVDGASVGDYIVAVQDGDSIKGLAIDEPDFSQYKKAVGRVRRILEDGRPEIAVIVH